MAEPHPEDERLMAYVDGELAADEAEAVRQMLANDSVAAARVALFEGTRAALQASPAAAPVSESLLTSVRTAVQGKANVVSFGRVPARPSRRWLPTAIAASLALVAGGVLGFGLAEHGRSRTALAGLVTDAQWHGALSELASGDSRDIDSGRLTAVASFRNGDGRLCREFGHRHTSGRGSLWVICQEDEGWRVAFQMSVTVQSDRDYGTASSHEALDTYLASNKAGPPLSKAEEASFLRKSN